ncbi:MAG: metallophosphoesterase [Candidatus Gastranaerophilales bacterium]|nr:metallophosphoesterase [Candidatus Gastranaerophilales bacterium]
MRKILFSIFVVFTFCIAVWAANPSQITIVHITDTQVDSFSPDVKGRMLSRSFDLYQHAITDINAVNPDIVVFSGDMINLPVKSEFKKFLALSDKIKAPWYAALGNHDVGVLGGLSKKEIITLLNANNPALKLQKPYYCIVKGDFVFIFMDGTSDIKITAQGYFPPEQLEFLDKTLTRYSGKNAVIVQHFPLMPPFKSNTHYVKNKDEYLKILDKHKNVIMLLAGHYHASSTVERNGVLHITTSAMLEYPHVFRVLTVKNNPQNVVITSKIVQTRLSDLLAKSKSISTAPELKEGEKTDNFFTITLEKK